MATTHRDVTVYPVSGWDTGPIFEQDALALRIMFRDVETNQMAETQFFGIPRGEVRKLIGSLTDALARLDADADKA